MNIYQWNILMNNTELKLYGVWIPYQGWLRGAEVFADHDYNKAKQVARLIGNNSVVRFIDLSIVDLENLYLEQERKSLWHTFKTYFVHKNNK